MAGSMMQRATFWISTAMTNDSMQGTRTGRHGLIPMACVVAVLAASVMTGGCATERVISDGRPMPPKPRSAADARTGNTPNQMSLIAGPKPDDSDGNGYPDLIHVSAALFDTTVPGSTSMPADGAFVFTLFRQGDIRRPSATPLGEWRFDAADVGAYRGRALYGVNYQFALNLLDVRSDAMPPIQADIRGRYEPSVGGAPVHTSDEVRRVQLGRNLSRGETLRP